LGEGRTICTDNSYTSVDLAKKLITMNTYLVGILRKNRRRNPKEVVWQKLKRGEIIARENKKRCNSIKMKEQERWTRENKREQERKI
jgi:hypothetical protein